MRLALAVCALVLVAPATALAALPVISYVDENNVFRLYDAQSGTEVEPPPPVPVADPATFRYGISLSGRYIVFTDATKKLHLLDRATNTQVPLPGVDVYPDPRSLTVADTGVIAFDNAGNGGAVLYGSASAQFAPTGLPALSNGHRETRLSGDGRLLATTCDDTLATCIAALDPGADAYVQDLSAESDTGFPNNALLGEEHPCIDRDGSLVGFEMGALGQHDIHVIDRSGTPHELTLPNLNDPAKNESNCVLDAAGAYVGSSRTSRALPRSSCTRWRARRSRRFPPARSSTATRCSARRTRRHRPPLRRPSGTGSSR